MRKENQKKERGDRTEQVNVAVNFLAHTRGTLGSNLGWDIVLIEDFHVSLARQVLE